MKYYRYLFPLLCACFILAGCNLPSGQPGTSLPPSSAQLTSSQGMAATLGGASATPTDRPTRTVTPSRTALPTMIPPSLTPTITPTATITPTPTFAFPRVTAIMQANCRYGPGTAYLYAHGMYTGDGGTVWGRNSSGTWLWIQPDNIAYQCWISTAVVDVQGDVFTVRVAEVRLPTCDMYGPPENVAASRDGDEVTVTWSRVPMTEDDDRGYLLEVTVCQQGALVWMAVHTDETFYTFTDEDSCDSDSGGWLYTVDKHGYSDPVEIPWP